MKFPETKFLIFNDSCYSGSFIEFVQAYKQIYTLINQNEQINVNLQVLFAFKFLFEYAIEKEFSDDPIDCVTELINFYQKVQIKDIELFNKIKSTCIHDDISLDTIRSLFDVNLKDIGFETFKDMEIFKMMIQFYEETTKKEKDSSMYYKDIFTKSNLDTFISLANNNIQEFIKTLNALLIAKDEIDFTLEPAQNIEIMTSTDAQHTCSSFSSIKISDAFKIYPGNPTMGSFIKQLFLQNDHYIDFENFRKEISEVDGKSIFFAIDYNQNASNKNENAFWIHFNPMHYKLSSINYSLDISKQMKKQIAALRAISFINVKKMEEAAIKLCKEAILSDPNPFNDTNADLLAITALLNDQTNNPSEIIRECFQQNEVIESHNPMRINSASLIIEFSFQLFKDPIKATGIIINILEAAVKKVLQQNMYLIIKGKQTNDTINKLFLKKEISKLKELQVADSLEDNDLSEFFAHALNDEKYNFVSKIENSILAFMSPSLISIATVIASSFFDEIDLKSIQKTYLEYCKYEDHYNFYEDDNDFNHFLSYINTNGIKTEKINSNNDTEKDKIENVRKYAKCYLLKCINKSFIFIDSILDAKIKSDSMKLVSSCISNVNAFSIVYVLNSILESNINDLFIDNIISPIEKLITENKISTFFIPSIICSMPVKTIFYALYISMSCFENDWYNKLLNSIETYKNDKSFGDVCVEILKLAKEELNKLENIKDLNQYQAEINKMKIEILEEIKKAIWKITKLQEISIVNAREYIIKRIDLNIIDKQTDSYINEIKFSGAIKSKFDEYLLASTKELYSLNKTSIDHEEITCKGFIIDESLKDTTNINKRAAKELNTVAYLFKISNDLPDDSIAKLTSKIDDESAIQYPLISMIARSFNIVEIAPIANAIVCHYKLFDPSEGSNPTLRELMGLQSAIIQIHPPGYNPNDYYKMVELKGEDAEEKESEKERIEKEDFRAFNMNNFQNDDDKNKHHYYALTESNPFRNLISKRKIYLMEEYKNLRISQAKIILIREILNLGCSQWTVDAWKSFVYCFNKRLNKTGIQFNENDDYGNDQCPSDINDEIRIVMNFYPLYKVLGFWQNKEQIEMFIGKYRNHHKEISQAFVRAFYDIDQIVTPLYFNRNTYEERTYETLKLIYDYNL